MAYYIETNAIAAVVALVLLVHGNKTTGKRETSNIVMNVMLYLLITLCVCDVAAYFVRGRNRFWSETVNAGYFLTMALGTYAWFLFVLVKVGYSSGIRSTMLLTGAPIVVLCIAILMNPWTHYFFLIDEEILYHRGTGIVWTWVVEWGYVAAALGVNIRAILKEKRSYRRSEFYGYLMFAVPMAVAAVAQMLFYGTTTAQVGYMLALLLAYLNQQSYQVQRDELTGLNNRNAFLNYRDSMVSRTVEQRLSIFMVDADKFKAINDEYGHLKGDQALREIAEALRGAAGEYNQNRLLLYRYGGDEFVILGINLTQTQVERLPALVRQKLDSINSENQAKGQDYCLAVSIGQATGPCETVGDFDELMKRADSDMYRVKQANGTSRHKGR